MSALSDLFAKLKDKKLWAPLVGTGALGAALLYGVEVGPEGQAAVVDGVVSVVENAEGLIAAAAALTVTLLGWRAVKK